MSRKPCLFLGHFNSHPHQMPVLLGFSLIELLCCFSLIAIFAIFALPSYTRLTERAARQEAQTALLRLAFQLETHYEETGHYPKIQARLTPSKTYRIEILEIQKKGFCLEAIALNAVSTCAKLIITSTGDRKPEACWL